MINFKKKILLNNKYNLIFPNDDKELYKIIYDTSKNGEFDKALKANNTELIKKSLDKVTDICPFSFRNAVSHTPQTAEYILDNYS